MTDRFDEKAHEIYCHPERMPHSVSMVDTLAQILRDEHDAALELVEKRIESFFLQHPSDDLLMVLKDVRALKVKP